MENITFRYFHLHSSFDSMQAIKITSKRRQVCQNTGRYFGNTYYCILSKNNMCAKVSNFEKITYYRMTQIKICKFKWLWLHKYAFLTQCWQSQNAFESSTFELANFDLGHPVQSFWQVLFQAVVLHKIAFFSYFAKLFCREIPHNMATRPFSIQGAPCWKKI